jgi:hypothetical protein
MAAGTYDAAGRRRAGGRACCTSKGVMQTDKLANADEALQRALREVPPGQRLRVVMTLDAPAPAAPPASPPSGARRAAALPSAPPRPLAKSAAAPAAAPGLSYREQLIEQRRRQLADALGPIIETLGGLSLTVHGGSLMPVVVVEGPAERIRESLKLPGVRHAVLDHAITIDRPSPTAPQAPSKSAPASPHRKAAPSRRAKTSLRRSSSKK